MPTKAVRLAECVLLMIGLAIAQQSQTSPQPAPDEKASAASQPSQSTAAESETKSQPAAKDSESKVIPPGSKVFVAPMPNGFETYVVAGMIKKQVPITVVSDRAKADFEITGITDSERAGWAKMLFLGSQNSNAQASVKATNLKSGVVAWGYAVHKTNSVRGKQSAAEACAKHLKEKIESKQ